MGSRDQKIDNLERELQNFVQNMDGADKEYTEQDFYEFISNPDKLKTLRSHPAYKELIGPDLAKFHEGCVSVDPHDGGPTDEEYLAMFFESK